MHLQLPRSLRYPVTITELHVQAGDDVKGLAHLLTYNYKTTFTEDTDDGTEVQVVREVPGTWESPIEGKLVRWMVGVGTVLYSGVQDIVEIEEPCAHPVQYDNMCAVCGKDMTERNYANFNNPDSASIRPTHDNTGLLISSDEALRIEEEVKRRLLAAKKLSLVVDLDQTIIHATVDPTVGEWRDDENNINHRAVEDVKGFQLLDDGSSGRGCWYYVKLRPGLKEFLNNVSKLYECHIYTMGTRAYAREIAKIVDPDQSVFGERILSRDESGSMTSKNLHRLFPVDTKMVVIIDDRGDVWKWSENLIKVPAYDFFVGIGDINSSFLPRRQEYHAVMPQNLPPLVVEEPPIINPEELLEPAGVPLAAAQRAEEQGTEDTVMEDASSGGSPAQDGTTSLSSLSTLEQLVTMSGGDDPDLLRAQTSQQSQALAAQQLERPLARRQEVLDTQDDAAEVVNGRVSQTHNHDDTQSETGRRHNLLQDNDRELPNLERALTEVHNQFFDEYERRLVASKGGRVAQVRGGKGPMKRPGTTDSTYSGDSKLNNLIRNVPDIKVIMPSMKRRVFDNTVMVFSGLIPLGNDVQSSDYAQLAKQFGAIVVEGVSASVTHVIAAKSRTAKVRSAAERFPHIRIVTLQWFYNSISAWRRLDETPHLINIQPLPEDRFASSPVIPPSSTGVDDLDDAQMLSTEEEEDEQQQMRNLQLQDKNSGDAPSEDTSPPDLNNVDWSTMDAELAEFMGSDADDTDLESPGSDAESVTNDSRSSLTATNNLPTADDASGANNKRDRSTTPPPDSEQNVDASKEGDSPLMITTTSTDPTIKSPLAKRQKVARDRHSALRTVTLSQNGEENMPPSPATSQSTTDNEQDGTTANADANSDGDESEFDFEAEMSKEFS